MKHRLASIFALASTAVFAQSTVKVSPFCNAPTLSFSANPMTLAAGSKTTLHWTTTGGVIGCKPSGDWGKPPNGPPTVGPNGSYTTNALSANPDTDFTLTCLDINGDTIAASINVDVYPVGRPPLSALQGIWTNNAAPSVNQSNLIMDNLGNFTVVGLLNSKWFAYYGQLPASYTTSAYYNPDVPGSCESCAGTANGDGPNPTATVTMHMVGTDQLQFTDSTNNISLTFTYLSSPPYQPATTLAAAQTVLQSIETSSFQGGIGSNPNCLSASNITLSGGVPALGIYVLTCNAALVGPNGGNYYQTGLTYTASGLVFIGINDVLIGGYGDSGFFNNLSTPANTLL